MGKSSTSVISLGNLPITKQDCPSVRGLRAVGGQPMHQTQHNPHQHSNSSIVSATNHHVSFSNRFNRSVNSSGCRSELTPLASPSVVQQAAAGHNRSSFPNSSSSVLKMRNRGTDSAPVVSHLTSATSHLASKDKFSKYSALPSIQTGRRPPLLRQRTYDVLEPVYVKGPLKSKDTIKLPEIPQVTSSSTKKTTETKKRNTNKPVSSPRTSEVTTKSRFQSPEKKNPTIVSGESKKKQATSTTTRTTRPRPQGFRPEQLSKDILPESPTAFWFPI